MATPNPQRRRHQHHRHENPADGEADQDPRPRLLHAQPRIEPLRWTDSMMSRERRHHTQIIDKETLEVVAELQPEPGKDLRPRRIHQGRQIRPGQSVGDGRRDQLRRGDAEGSQAPADEEARGQVQRLEQNHQVGGTSHRGPPRGRWSARRSGDRWSACRHGPGSRDRARDTSGENRCSSSVLPESVSKIVVSTNPRCPSRPLPRGVGGRSDEFIPVKGGLCRRAADADSEGLPFSPTTGRCRQRSPIPGTSWKTHWVQVEGRAGRR